MRPKVGRPALSFAAARDGIAAVEFALLGPVLLLLTAVMVNLGYAYFIRLRVANATTAASMYAQANGGAVTTSTAAAFLSAVKTVAQDTLGLSQTAAVATSFNNATDGSNAGTYYCVTGYPATWTSTGSSAASCPNGTSSGKFVRIAISVNPGQLLIDAGLPGWSSAIADSATVRVR